MLELEFPLDFFSKRRFLEFARTENKGNFGFLSKLNCKNISLEHDVASEAVNYILLLVD